MSETTNHAHNVPGVIPHLIVRNAHAAIDFYIRAFGATPVMQMPAEDGKRLLHAQLLINGGPLMLCDDFPEYCTESPTEFPRRPPVTLHLAVGDIDAVFAQALAAGGEPVMAPADMFWGDRYAQLRDPFNHIWSLSTPSKPGAKAQDCGPETAKA
ncbi:VOC family protein [Niveispirillum fermenti]|uniref:VOC family protein n=1 Tax=Niveispirillum fermenti TaxID=1233113 RepID=UPI003A8692BF